MEPEMTGKKIVSKGEYAANLGKKAALSSYGSAVFLLGVVCMVLTVVGAILLLIGLAHHPNVHDGVVFLLGVGMFVVCSTGLLHFGKEAIREARETEAGVPLTRANTADLPAPESLVRASEEPRQEQQAVLLRAGMEAQGTPPEQLVRPVD